MINPQEEKLPKSWRTAWTRDFALVRRIARMALIENSNAMIGATRESEEIAAHFEGLRELLYGKDKPLIGPIVEFSALMLKYHMFDLEWQRARIELGGEEADGAHYAPLSDQEMKLLERYVERRRQGADEP